MGLKNMLSINLIVSVVVFALIYSNCAKKANFRMFKIGNCSNLKRTQLLASYITYANSSVKGNTYYLAAEMKIGRDLPVDMDLLIQLEKCKDRSFKMGCEKYHDFKIPKMCHFLILKGPWSPYFRSLEPTMSCPMKKGYYKTPGLIPYETQGIPGFMLSTGYFYKMIVKILDSKTNQILSCTQCEGDIFYN